MVSPYRLVVVRLSGECPEGSSIPWGRRETLARVVGLTVGGVVETSEGKPLERDYPIRIARVRLSCPAAAAFPVHLIPVGRVAAEKPGRHRLVARELRQGESLVSTALSEAVVGESVKPRLAMIAIRAPPVLGASAVGSAAPLDATFIGPLHADVMGSTEPPADRVAEAAIDQMPVGLAAAVETILHLRFRLRTG